MIQEPFDYPEYLRVKKGIDDQSLDPGVWQTMIHWAIKHHRLQGELKVLEIGAGIGTMIERFLSAAALPSCDYTALEQEIGFGRVACSRLQQWGRQHNLRLQMEQGDIWHLLDSTRKLTIKWMVGDAIRIRELFRPGSFNLVISHAVIDLLPVPLCMPDILGCLAPGGGFYFSLNYAGETGFQPPLPDDAVISTAYNQDMDRRFPELAWQPSHTGLRLGAWLTAQGHEVTGEHSSNWNLSSTGDPRHDHNRFIGNILDTMEKALAGMPGLDRWLVQRREQLSAGELGFHASNRDVFGLVGNPGKT